MTIITQFFPTEAPLLAFAAQLASLVVQEVDQQRKNLTHKAFTLFLIGPLGAGKTTFARGFLRALSVAEKIKSPTYTLVESYAVSSIEIFHFDLYRLNDPSELTYLSLEDYFAKTAICLIEWPEKGKPLLPEADLSCYIGFKEGGRELTCQAHSVSGTRILASLLKKTVHKD